MTTVVPRPGTSQAAESAGVGMLPATRGGARMVVTSAPIDAVDPISLYAAAAEAGHEAALLLSPREGVALLGVGRAWAAEPSGPARFREAETAWRALLEEASLPPATLPRGVGPVLLGGLGFSGRAPRGDDRWAPFGAASLVLPSLTLAVMPDGAWLTTALERRDDTDPDSLAATWQQLVAAARSGGQRRHGEEVRAPEATLSVSTERPDAAGWVRSVALFAGAVGRGRLDKVVLARRVDLVSDAELDVAAALGRLRAGAPESTTFAFSRAGRTFLGATPERLVRTDGREFRTVAVAGTAGRGTDRQDDADLATGLLASEKDLEEHAVVVDAIRTALAPLAEELSVAPEPTVLTLRHLQHLVTPIEGRLHERSGLLSLAGTLHPTPAVGGAPRELALALIDEHEGFERGWYGGPIGWLGADGDGELWVALRCGIVEGTMATLFAGCGIVADSDPEDEWHESRLKLRALATVLGHPGDEP